MKILLNLYPVQSGGGQQVAHNMLKVLKNNDFGHEWYFYVGENSELDKIAKNFFESNKILSVPYSYRKRIVNKSLVAKFVSENNIDIIYNYSPVLAIKNIPQVVRSVYSNLYFPEVDFWKDYGKITRIKKKIIDYLRLRGTLKAQGLIFENDSMLEQAHALFHYPKSNMIHIMPSVSEFNETECSNKYLELSSSSTFKILYLSSWHLNKRIDILPKVAALLKQSKTDIKFVLTLDSNNPDVQKYLISKIKDLEVEKYFELIGTVPAKYVHQVVKMCDAMVLLSKLECFSSNVMEAFHFKKPLLISNEPWAVAACNNAALYVSRDSDQDIYQKIKKLVLDKHLYNDLVEKGSIRLNDFNSPISKVRKQIEFLEYVYENNKK